MSKKPLLKGGRGQKPLTPRPSIDALRRMRGEPDVSDFSGPAPATMRGVKPPGPRPSAQPGETRAKE